MADSPNIELDAHVRSQVYSAFLEKGGALRSDVAEALGVPAREVAASFERLAEGKALVLQPESREILMAEPFSAVPTPFTVEDGSRWWWGNCIWDALGIPAALHRDARVVTSCADCGEAMTLVVESGRLVPAEGVVHFSVPVKDWWRDVAFT